MTKEVYIDYDPRPHQEFLHDNFKKKNIIIMHRRAGKTVGLINELIKQACCTGKPDARYAYIAPFYNQAKSIAWDYLKYYTAPLPNTKVNESELRVDLFNGSRVRLFGADNYNSLRGLYLDGVIFDEYADISPQVYLEVIKPALMDRDGFVCFAGTPKGQNHFYEMYEKYKDDPEWFVTIQKASQTKILPQKALDEAKASMPIDLYNQEFECDFYGSIHGAYYADYIKHADVEGRIGAYPYDPILPVYTFWDIGIGDATAITFAQVVNREIRVIDYYENNGESLSHYIQKLQSKNYLYAEHFAPHDIEVREFSSGKSRLEIAQSLGIKFRITPKMSVDDGINAVRTILPRCFFDKGKTDLLVKCLKNYKKEWDDKRQVFKSYPLHDWSSHGADSARYMAINIDKLTKSHDRSNMANFISEL